RKPDEKLFTGRLLYEMMKRGIKIALGTIGAFALGFYIFGKDLPSDEALILGRTMAFCAIVFSQMIYVFLIRGKEKLGIKKRLFGNKYLFFAVLASITAQILVLAIPQMNSFFGTVFPNAIQWAIIIIISILSAVI
ncbi:MAG: cation-translocating P-type ATPase C-terminal domain-containing protein, partial [bacterium]|nr:cation-translocating P-type ATPase C-terminal domain-containing protein [bacterium]